MRRQHSQAFSSLHIPNPDGFIERSRNNHIRLRIEIGAEDIISVAAERLDERSGGDVPEANGFVVGGGDEESRIGREGDIGDAEFVAGEFVERGENFITAVGLIDGVSSEGFIG